MPTYDYQCETCGHQMEAFQTMSAKPLKKCPQCGKPTLRRLIGTGAGIIFKGSGFWQTDYRSDSYKKAKKADSDTASGKDESASNKSEKSSGKSEKSDSSPGKGGEKSDSGSSN